VNEVNKDLSESFFVQMDKCGEKAFSEFRNPQSI
jgi:hypothetical protein